MKTKKLEDYLPLYVGSKVWTTHLALNNGEPQALTVSINNLFNILYKYQDSKLILRPLPSMTEEEQKELEATKALQRPSPVHHIAMMVWTAESYRWALSKGFDLFGLIDSGLAINAETLK